VFGVGSEFAIFLFLFHVVIKKRLNEARPFVIFVVVVVIFVAVVVIFVVAFVVLEVNLAG
jgi:hypothetical protein